MGPGQGSYLVGIVEYVAITAMMVLVIWACFDDRLARGVRTLGRRLHLLPELVASPPNPPIERLAADVRRLRLEVDGLPNDIPMARRRGILAAYDDVLDQACAALDIDHQLAGLPPGPDREAARFRSEYLLEKAGLRARRAA
ncbi:MAG: hypothetical protein M3Z50_06205 [Actinomycetota bacterium]|nr:hypothetical protein [Actinomycetota bacterium]